MKSGRKPIEFRGMKLTFLRFKMGESHIYTKLICGTKINSVFLHLNLKLCSQWLLQDSKEKTEEIRL